MVYRVYVEKKPELAHEAKSLLADIRDFLQLKNIINIRIINRYDVQGISEELFNSCVGTVFSEPQVDIVSDHLDTYACSSMFAVEPLPGQFDQRADSAAQCIQIISQGERPLVRAAKIYMLYGNFGAPEIAQIKKYVINPVETREASLKPVESLELPFESPEMVETLAGFTALDEQGLSSFLKKMSLAMDLGDLRFCQEYFKSERRDPTITELRMIDTYWSDHCRHTTFLTSITDAQFESPLLQSTWEEYLGLRRSLGRDEKPVTLMDLATIATRYFKAAGRLPKLDESEEVNACTVKIDVDVNGVTEPWLLLFKNETHNHPTEIEPFGGAATCIGGAIRDPLSGRAYVYSAMRVTGAADPLKPVSETIPGKLPQRKIVTTAAAGYSSYGNQIGLATGQVDELYHPGYAAKRMEIGAVVAAAPSMNVIRERPEPGDVVILLGGRTGRDGCGGATGSSKAHDASSLESCGSEVQKGNAPEERKIQRLFRNPEASRLIRRCNDFGAGGVSVAIGELADGLEIDLDAVPKKYEGLDGTELAISESQERMAVVVAQSDAKRFMQLSDAENLESTIVATVTEARRLVMRWRGKIIVDISREFLDSNGAEKHTRALAAAPSYTGKDLPCGGFEEDLRGLAADLNVCSKRGLSERFDSTIGAGTVLMPFGGRNQLTPAQVMANKISLESGETDTCSLMSWGFNPFISERSPYHGAYLAVAESVSKLVASGAEFNEVYLSFQEYFERLGTDEKRWGKPLSALLGAFRAQIGLGAPSIGGKDSMSGSFEGLNVPPTLVSFAVTTEKVQNIISPEFKSASHAVRLLLPEYGDDGLPTAESLLMNFETVTRLCREDKILSAWTPGYGGVAEGIMKMCFGNGIGFKFGSGISRELLFGYLYGAFILELSGEADIGIPLGETIEAYELRLSEKSVSLDELLAIYEGKLEDVFPCNIKTEEKDIPEFSYAAEGYPKPALHCARPRVLIPVFPGTNCEYDSARAFESAGAEPEIVVIRNLTAAGITDSVSHFAKRLGDSQMVFIPGGFSGGDEPDGSGKFITAFFRNAAVKDATHELLLSRDGLMCGICNGFQALIKLGLVPYGRILEPDESFPTLTYNVIGRHQSRLVCTRVASNKSPWLAATAPGEMYTVPISHGEGRFVASEELIKELAANGQIATQYVGADGRPTADIRFNPNGSDCAVEGITSPDGRVLGKMGHSERVGNGLYKNVPGNYDIGMFRSAVEYFK